MVNGVELRKSAKVFRRLLSNNAQAGNNLALFCATVSFMPTFCHKQVYELPLKKRHAENWRRHARFRSK